jgi:hypothetical protein
MSEHAPRNDEGRYLCCGGFGEHFTEPECYTGRLEVRLRAAQDALADLVYRVESHTWSIALDMPLEADLRRQAEADMADTWTERCRDHDAEHSPTWMESTS